MIKNKEYKKICMAFLFFPLSAMSETDSFDMSLSGEFKKEFCEISHIVVTRDDIVNNQMISEFIDASNLPASYTAGRDRYEILCSYGVYDIAIYSDSPQQIDFPETNLSLTTTVWHKPPTGQGLTGEGSNKLYNGHHSKVFDVLFNEASSGIPHEIKLYTNAVPTDGKLANIKAGSFSHTYNYTIVIDAKN